MITPDTQIITRIQEELGLPRSGVTATVELLAAGNTVPFVARYRKEATGALDEVQIRAIEERADYLRALEERRQTVISSLDEQGVVDPALRSRVLSCATKAELEDLYLPYRPKRRTRATIAREKGLEPLATRIMDLPRDAQPSHEAAAFVNPELGVESAEDALAGARDIVAESVAERAEVRRLVRDALAQYGVLTSRVVRGKKEEGKKFEQYFDYREATRKIPSHRYLAIRRGEKEGFLRARIELDADPLLGRIRSQVNFRSGTPFSTEFHEAIDDAYERLLHPALEADVLSTLKEEADRSAVGVFASNLENLLLSAPLGTQAVIGIDPGIRTGCKCVHLDAQGKFLDHCTIYPLGSRASDRARRDLLDFVERHPVRAIAVGNGTGGRETEAFVREALRESHPDIVVVSVNESGASIYSASDVAREEFPDLDLTLRGAISIGRRLQDPLAELVKIDPKSIGVGQYQHDVHAGLLKRTLDGVVETCVNKVGVELNTASASLLSYVAGIGPRLARKIVEHRDAEGSFPSRKALLDVPGLGRKTFEQSAGFLRVQGGKHPLDASAVHPERYTLVEKMARDLKQPVATLVGNAELADRLRIHDYVGDSVGEHTLGDIVNELRKPGRDPRDTFEPPRFRDDVHELADLEVDMVLEGLVTNVTDFGAFVDVGVHQDGLVHISQLADHFVKDPHQVVQVGQKLTVRVLTIDPERRRIGLSARSDPSPD